MPDHLIHRGQSIPGKGRPLKAAATKLQSSRHWFAWHPIRISTGERVWLRWVMRIETQRLGTLAPRAPEVSYERVRLRKAANAP